MDAPIVRLEVVAGKAAGMSIVVEDELLIGRHADGAGRLADDGEISRTHARLSLDGSGFFAIEDLGSTNGTFVNGLRISSPQTLAEGDAIEVGGTTLVIRELPGSAAEQPRPVTTRRTSIQRPAVPPAGPAKPAAGPEPAPKPAPAATEVASGPQTEVQRRRGAPPTLSLKLEVDFGAREATITLSEGSEPVKLVFDGGVWRPAASSG